ncbi:MAG: aminotransferase class III-fold pyridoxal phosphate-dependent enzyme [Candidatus Omnitrophica bacterium]|nr:aminotransferase class III-fold pyridoxal phosphate-dependent enzyme [Candidatus Omnitrophota bacterium]MBD3268926.1 aminotransferase class III-fold pyridoxal phosphate-dependent enzyme [Candidatus Omnitrophota bacterium]
MVELYCPGNKRRCMNNGRWYKLEDAENILSRERIYLTREYVNPGMASMFKMLGFDKLWAHSARGDYIFLEDGRKILDMTGGNCVLGLGHNHPRILAARKHMAQENRLEICKSFLSPYVAALAANMANILPGDLQYSFFCNSGAESIEGALKMAEKYQGKKKQGIVYTDHSFHGKTHAAMSISSMDESRNCFHLLDGCFRIPYGDAHALRRIVESRTKEKGESDIGVFVLEAVHGTRLIFPPQGYLKEIRRICDEYNIVLIADEIYTGFGRTGYWFAFESEGIVPDIVCYSKTFGGGKASIAGYTARKEVFIRAYGAPQDSMIHSSTFSGMSEECATAIEALNIIKDNNLVERSADMGEYLGSRLKELGAKYSKKVKEVRGRGLLWGLELYPLGSKARSLVEKVAPEKLPIFSKLTGGVVLAELLHSHDILAYLGFSRRNLVVFSPSLLIEREDLDKALEGLDEVLAKNWFVLVKNFIGNILSR